MRNERRFKQLFFFTWALSAVLIAKAASLVYVALK
jgi:hypothetical protein